MSKVNVYGRLSYPSLFQPTSFQGEGEKKYQCSVIMDKEESADSIKRLQEVIKEVMSEKWRKPPQGLKIGLRDGKEKEGSDGYGSGVMFFTARSKNRPTTVNRDRSQVAEEDGVFYPGCYCNFIVEPWCQDNKFGKRVNFTLYGVQFVAQGDAFGDASPVGADDFEDLGEEKHVSFLD